MEEDIAQVRCVLKGDKSAFMPLMKKYYPRMAAYVRNTIVTGKEDCEDVVASIFATAYLKLHLYNDSYAFSTWLYRIAHNQCIDHIRAVSRRRTVPITDDIPATDVLYEIEGKEVVTQLLKHVSEYERSVLEMHYCEGMKYKEIAEVVDVSPGTIAVQIARAKKSY